MAMQCKSSLDQCNIGLFDIYLSLMQMYESKEYVNMYIHKYMCRNIED